MLAIAQAADFAANYQYTSRLGAALLHLDFYTHMNILKLILKTIFSFFKKVLTAYILCFGSLLASIPFFILAKKRKSSSALIAGVVMLVLKIIELVLFQLDYVFEDAFAPLTASYFMVVMLPIPPVIYCFFKFFSSPLPQTPATQSNTSEDQA